jgi:thiol-disulfide isomerase/thioredoxin
LKNHYRDVANTPNREEEIEIYMFSVDWCAHCKKAKPDWIAFQNQYNGTVVKGFTIKCVTIDCTNDSDESTQQYIMKYGITSYPTVIALRNNEKVDFDAKITKSSLDQFLQSLVNE